VYLFYNVLGIQLHCIGDFGVVFYYETFNSFEVKTLWLTHCSLETAFTSLADSPTANYSLTVD